MPYKQANSPVFETTLVDGGFPDMIWTNGHVSGLLIIPLIMISVHILIMIRHEQSLSNCVISYPLLENRWRGLKAKAAVFEIVWLMLMPSATG